MRILKLAWNGWLVAAVASVAVYASNGVIFFQSVPSLTSAISLGRVNADGSGIANVPVNLPSVFNPIVSRDGLRMLVTSPDPGRPFKQSRNVYVIDLLNGNVTRATSYEDEVVQNGVRFNQDLAQLFGNTTISSYKIYFPNYKAFSPNGAQIVVMNLSKGGSINLGTALDPSEVQSSSGRLPFIDVYDLSTALPAGAFVYLSPQVRDGFNQGGDGIDWHPVLNEVVGAVAGDVPAVGNAGRTSMEGTLLAVFSTTGISAFKRKLTNPVGEIDAFIDINGVISTAAGPHDYAPTISPDGRQVAFVRHTLRQDNRFDGAGIAPLPALCAIHVVNYDGSNERTILRLNEGLWVTKLAWSPDGSEIAFDLAPQVQANGFNIQSGDLTRSEIDVVRADGTNPRLLVGAPASFPTWSPLGFNPQPGSAPTVRLRLQGNTVVLDVGNLTPGTSFVVERSAALSNWSIETQQQAAGISQTVVLNLPDRSAANFYRVRAL